MSTPILLRILSAIERFERSEVDIPGLQYDIEALGSALEGDQREVAEGLRALDNDLEAIRFGCLLNEQRSAAYRRIDSIKALVESKLASTDEM